MQLKKKDEELKLAKATVDRFTNAVSTYFHMNSIDRDTDD